MAYSVLSDGTTKAKATGAAVRARRDPMRWVVLAILILLLAFTLFPFFLALLNAVKASAEYAVGGPLSIPGRSISRRSRNSGRFLISAASCSTAW